jgi:hypothetical protein
MTTGVNTISYMNFNGSCIPRLVSYGDKQCKFMTNRNLSSAQN